MLRGKAFPALFLSYEVAASLSISYHSMAMIVLGISNATGPFSFQRRAADGQGLASRASKTFHGVRVVQIGLNKLSVHHPPLGILRRWS